MPRLAPALLASSMLALAACGPVPGGTLSGTPVPAPPDWSTDLVDGRGFCEIESRPEDPHSIQLECFVRDGKLYVQSHRFAYASWWPVESWASIWLEHPDVRVRLGDRIYDLRAVRLEEPALRASILRERGYDPVPEGIAVFRFEPRGA